MIADKEGMMNDLINTNWPQGLEQKPVEDRRNVIDHYKNMSDELIRGLLNEKRNDLIVICENYASDFNLSSTIRNANAFTAKETWIVGNKKYDRRGTVGTHNYESIKHSPDTQSLLQNLRDQGYRIVIMDNIEGAESIETYEWQPKTALIMGQEKIGVSQTAIDMADDVVYIPMRGSTRSLNVAVASGIAMYDYSRKLGLNE
jgi:tRNA G18 (ribose-2'-O)-methylase SpoU